MSRTEREYTRYAYNAAVTLVLGGKRFSGKTSNVSRGGLCVMIDDALAVGTDLDVDVVLMLDDAAQSAPLRVPARVVWCTLVDDAHQVGLSFRALDAERTSYLAQLLRYLDSERDARPKTRESIDERFR